MAQYNLLNVASASMAHAAKKHQLIANNIAHSDTPDYIGKDLKAFSLDDVSEHIQQKATRETHLRYSEASNLNSVLENPMRQSAFDETINQNKISVEEELAKAADAIASHSLASGVWRKSLSIMMNVIDSRR